MDTKHTHFTRRKALALSAGYTTLMIGGSASAQTGLKTPGVYIVEKNAFSNSVVAVATSIPAFIGHTEKTTYKALSDKNILEDKSLVNKPMRITSMAEFHKHFGGAPAPKFDLIKVQGENGGSATRNHTLPLIQVSGTISDTQDTYDLVQANQSYALYGAMRHFFLNGGKVCYIASTGSYADDIDANTLQAGLTSLEKVADVTLIVIPEAIRLPQLDATKLQRSMLKHCEKMKTCFAILDVFAGHRLGDLKKDPIHDFRNNIGTDNLGYGAAYYPWLKTTVFHSNEFTYKNLTDNARTLLVNLGLGTVGKTDTALINKIKQIAPPVALATTRAQNSDMGAITKLDKALRVGLPVYTKIMNAITEFVNCMPPSAAIAGVYTRVDNERGVWNAPANVELKSVTGPSVIIPPSLQGALNVTPSGKSINAIRSFPGNGTLVWGALTLDANSQDWRYIQVRRTMIMLEESIKLMAREYVFAANDANTWVTVRSSISSFLTEIWGQGGLQGVQAPDAFQVSVGLGSTMTVEDILGGIMRITVKVAIIRPAEFIVFTIEQEMQKS